MSTNPIGRYDPAHTIVQELPLHLSADRVRRYKFDSTSFGRRGYDQQSVERFQVQVADVLDMLYKQLAESHSDVQRLSSQLELHRHGVLPSRSSAPGGPSAREVDLLSAAQREAEQIVGQAHDYAQRVVAYAREQCNDFMMRATAHAKAEAERIIEEERVSAGAAFTDTAARQEAIRVVGELMLSHLQAAARQLDTGAAKIAQAVEGIPARPSSSAMVIAPPGGRPPGRPY